MLFFAPPVAIGAAGAATGGLGGGRWSRRAALLALLVAVVSVALPAAPRASSDVGALATARGGLAAITAAVSLSSSSSSSSSAWRLPPLPLADEEDNGNRSSYAYHPTTTTMTVRVMDPLFSDEVAGAPSAPAAEAPAPPAAASATTTTATTGVSGSVWLKKAGVVSHPEGVSVACYRGASAVPFCRAVTGGADGAFLCSGVAAASVATPAAAAKSPDVPAVAAALATAEQRARSSRALRKMASAHVHGPVAATTTAPPPPPLPDAATPQQRRGGLLSRALRESAERPARRAEAAAEAWRLSVERTAFCVFSPGPGQQRRVEPVVSAPFDLADGNGGSAPSVVVRLPPVRLYPDRSRDGVPTNGCGPRVYLAPTGRVNATALAIVAAERAAAAADAAPSPQLPPPRRRLLAATSLPLPIPLPTSVFRLPRAMPVVDVGGALIPDLAFGGPCHAHDACYGTDGESRAGCDEEFEALALSACRARSLLGSGAGGVAGAWGSGSAAAAFDATAAADPSAAAAVARALALEGGAAAAEERLTETGACARLARTYVTAVRSFGGRSWVMSEHQRRLMAARRR
jgi:hypothetical protein